MRKRTENVGFSVRKTCVKVCKKPRFPYGERWFFAVIPLLLSHLVFISNIIMEHCLSTKPKLVVVALKLKRDICMCIIISLYIMCFDEVKKLAHDLRKNK